MRNPARFLRVVSAIGVCVAASAVAGHALAKKTQTTPTPPLPNVMLLLDNSGSMEAMIDGTDPESSGGNADPVHCPGLPSKCSVLTPGTGPFTATCANRWGTILQTMTGQFSNGYFCMAQDRSGPTFRDEYTVNGAKPYDYGYTVPYHRPVSQDSAGNYCTVGPWYLSDNGGSGTGVGAAGFGSHRQTKNDADEYGADALAVFDASKIFSTASKTAPLSQSCNPDLAAMTQIQDGVIDSARDLARFGLMTFDADTKAGTGMDTSTPVNNLPANFFDGNFSYFPAWDGVTWLAGACPWPGAGGQCQGRPDQCATLADFEVGARNPAAPMWEGRMVTFPDPAAPLTDVEATNDYVQRVMLATRPYGATPIQGMLWDARNYFFNDPNGPYRSDPYSSSANGAGVVGCRDQYIVLMTDGTPNLDLERSCQTQTAPNVGKCPFTLTSNNDRSEDISKDLAAGGPGGTFPTVTTFVIGFAMSTDLSPAGGLPLNTKCDSNLIVAPGAPPKFTPTGDLICNTANVPGLDPPVGGPLEACCMLQKIAIAGTPSGTPGVGAYFVDNGQDLSKVFSAILGQITDKASSKTVPSFSPVLSSLASSIAVSSQYLASFDTTNPAPGSGNSKNSNAWPWSGSVQRIRTKCDTSKSPPAVVQPIDCSAGDDFRINVDSNSTTRNVLTVQDQGTPIDSTMTMRQYIPSDVDGATARQGFEIGADLTALMSTLTPTYLGINSPCPAFTWIGTAFGQLSAVECEKAVLGFALGQAVTPSPTSGTYDFAGFFSRAKGNANNFSALGAILHANPVVVPPPSAQARDDSYRAFATNNQNRPQVLYAVTIDGLLHAFDATSEPPPKGFSYTNGATAINVAGTNPATCTTSNAPTNNEMWSFIPPAVLPALKSNYPGGGSTLLDGAPIAKDVVFDRTDTSLVTPWHTALVAGMGSAGTGYYALDISDPLVAQLGTGHWNASTSTLPPAPADSPVPARNTVYTSGKGPHFLWQLAKLPVASNEVQLFGSHSATPAITTLAIADSSSVVHEVGVAILPGGVSGSPTGTCTRATKATNKLPAGSLFPARTKVREWSSVSCGGAGIGGGVAGRSVTIVRLDTGEIIRTFGRYTAGTPTLNDIPGIIAAKSRQTNTPLDSPMTGTPVVYPAQVGAVATKFYVGDIDGTIWRFDVSNNNPALWIGEIFFDAFNTDALSAANLPAPTTGSKPSNANQMAAIGQPISVLPVTSLDSAGNLVMHVATGDQDTFSTTVFMPGKDNDKDDYRASFNFVYSLRETVGTGQSYVNWYLPWADGERVTGPMTVFDGAAYFATFAPSAGNVCQTGAGKIWGMDFAAPASCSIGNNVGCGGADNGKWIKTPASPFTIPAADLPDVGLTGHVITGVALQATPPCSDASAANDTFTGGTYTGLSNLSQASYSIVASASTKATAKNTTKQPNQLGGSLQINLPSPKMKTRIDSWASIVE